MLMFIVHLAGRNGMLRYCEPFHNAGWRQLEHAFRGITLDLPQWTAFFPNEVCTTATSTDHLQTRTIISTNCDDDICPQSNHLLEEFYTCRTLVRVSYTGSVASKRHASSSTCCWSTGFDEVMKDMHHHSALHSSRHRFRLM